MIVDHTKEKNKRKKVEEQSNHLLYFMYVRQMMPAQPDNHDGIIIQEYIIYKLYMVL